MAPLRFHDGTQWTSYLDPQSGGTPSKGLDPTDATTRMLLPVGRTPLSIVAGYVALFSILLVPAPVALVLGICALVQLNHRPDRYGRGRAIFAIAMGGIFTCALVGLLIYGAVGQGS
jgi:hypothetical protein